MGLCRGLWLSWESAAFASRRSGVRIPSGPLPQNRKGLSQQVQPLFVWPRLSVLTVREHAAGCYYRSNAPYMLGAECPAEPVKMALAWPSTPCYTSARRKRRPVRQPAGSPEQRVVSSVGRAADS